LKKKTKILKEWKLKFWKAFLRMQSKLFSVAFQVQEKMAVIICSCSTP